MPSDETIRYVNELGRLAARCDKCGEPVPHENDAVALELLLTGNIVLIGAQPRHLLPTENCPGSPSRAQYLEGQPRDPRPQYSYEEYLEGPVRAAYAKMQEGRH